MENIALLIFDEAHHCVKQNPSAVLMRNWYFQMAKEKRPKVLGLSASIVQHQSLEAVLDSRVVTPVRSRSELMQHVNRPVLQCLWYSNNGCPYVERLVLLGTMIGSYELSKDPFFLGLSAEEQQEFLAKDESPFCLQELKALFTRAKHIFDQLGPHMADWYLENSITSMLARIESIGPLSEEIAITAAEAVHLSIFLRSLQVATKKRKRDEEPEISKDYGPHTLSPKLRTLIEFLETEWTEKFTGLIFVQQRALAHALAYLLSGYRFQRAKLRVQSFIGMSNVQTVVKRLVEQIMPHNQKGVLENFRSAEREINLLVATDVLAEGVDVPDCHLVICFDAPTQITSYIQKRGRARMKNSKYILMLEEGMDDGKIKRWQKLEEDLERLYQDEKRARAISEQLENRDDKCSATIQFRVPSTGALLDFDNALPKLHHVCQCALSESLVDSRPRFAFKEHPDRTVTATVILPVVFEPNIRVTSSSVAWLTEKAAKRDAAFNALRKLYEHGLLDEHLLPPRPRSHEPDELDVDEKSGSFCAVLPRMNPWVDIALALQSGFLDWHCLDVMIEELGGDQMKMDMVIFAPISLPALPEYTVFWDHHAKYVVRGVSSQVRRAMNAEDIEVLREHTDAIIRLTHGSRMPAGHLNFPFLISLSSTEIKYWQKHRDHQSPIDDLEVDDGECGATSRPGIVLYGSRKYLFKSFKKASFNEDGVEEEAIEATVFPKRRDFLHPLTSNQHSYTRTYLLPTAECVLESWGLTATMKSLFVPSLLHRIELSLLTERLRAALVPHFCDENLPLLQTAITARSAREQESYERLELFGDAYFNFLTSLNVMVERPYWPEGFLTMEKSRRVANDTLCKAALSVCLDQYIILKPFTGLKWVPPDVEKLLVEASQPKGREQGPKKRLADVVESTIAAAYLDGGHSGAIKLCKTYFPQQMWECPERQALELFSRAGEERVHLEALENLVGYKFRKPSLLLEAITSSMYKGGDQNARSYERLEFFGDAVLDYLVVRRIYAFNGRELPHNAMHSFKCAVVNSWILGYLCMEHCIWEERNNIVMKPAGHSTSYTPEIEQTSVKKHIWQYLRPGLRTEKENRSLERFEKMRNSLKYSLETCTSFPWPLISRFNPAKVFSDLIETILGAIYIDSHANEEKCDSFLTHIGLYRILDRLLEDNVACMHPKELLGILAQQRKVSYTYSEEDQMFTCQVLFDGKPVGKVAQAETKDIASTLAAETVIECERGEEIYDVVEKAWKVVNEEKSAPDSEVDDGLLREVDDE
ncbi:hypothetical protein, variant [Verruconis gallopava]|nr:hypothetical protein, variant [Verruconis gallopava]KIW06292.1 hypothetical protein, variant [Verruconis gallopava]